MLECFFLKTAFDRLLYIAYTYTWYTLTYIKNVLAEHR